MTDTEPQSPLWMEYWTLDRLVPDPTNPKAHDIDLLRRSMGRFGYTEPIVVDERTGLLLSGHGRREILTDDEAKGSPPPERVVLDDDGRWTVPVVRGVTTANDEEAHAYLIAANQTGMKAGWIPESLARLLEEVQTTPLGLGGVGFDDSDVTRLLAESGVTGDREAAFLADLASTGDGGGTHGALGSDDGLAFVQGPTLALTFRSQGERQEVIQYLRGVAKKMSVETMAAAMLHVVRGELTAQKAVGAGA